MEQETFVGKILHTYEDGHKGWLDYARGTEVTSRRWHDGDPKNRVVVDWLAYGEDAKQCLFCKRTMSDTP